MVAHGIALGANMASWHTAIWMYSTLPSARQNCSTSSLTNRLGDTYCTSSRCAIPRNQSSRTSGKASDADRVGIALALWKSRVEKTEETIGHLKANFRAQ